MDKINSELDAVKPCRYAEVLDESRALTTEEDHWFDQGANAAYKEFRDKAAESRGMTADQMEEFAQV